MFGKKWKCDIFALLLLVYKTPVNKHQESRFLSQGVDSLVCFILLNSRVNLSCASEIVSGMWKVWPYGCRTWIFCINTMHWLIKTSTEIVRKLWSYRHYPRFNGEKLKKALWKMNFQQFMLITWKAVLQDFYSKYSATNSMTVLLNTSTKRYT